MLTTLVMVSVFVATGHLTITLGKGAGVGDTVFRTASEGESASSQGGPGSPGPAAPVATGETARPPAPGGGSAVTTTAPPTTRAPASSTGGTGGAGGPTQPGPPTDEPDGGAPPPVDGSVDEPAATPEQPADTATPAQPDPAAEDPCASGALSATDQGVTETTVKIGFASFTEPTTNDDLTGDFGQKVNKPAHSWVKEVNALGGICGREVIYAIAGGGPWNADAQLAACKRLILDEKVFAVVAFTSFDTSAGQMCVTKDNQTPLITMDHMPESYYAEAAPYLWCTCMSMDRMFRNWARMVKDSGYGVPGSDKIGVLYEQTPHHSTAVESTLLTALKAEGFEVTTFGVSPDFAQASNQIPSAVLQFRQAGVTLVFPIANLWLKGQFMTRAQEQLYFPRYTDSDIRDGQANYTTNEGNLWPYPERQFDRALLVTTTYAGMYPDTDDEITDQGGNYGGWYGSDFHQYADQVYERWNEGGFEADRPATQFEEDLGLGVQNQRMINSTLGSHLMIFVDAAERAGPNLTRASFVEAMANTGTTTLTGQAPHYTFGPGLYDGGDQLALSEWRAEAMEGYGPRRFHQIAPHGPPPTS